MSDKMRWRYGDTNPVVAAVDAATVIEIGDLVYQDTDDAKPASAQADQGTRGGQPGAVCRQVPGRGHAAEPRRATPTPIRVATTGVFEFDCPSGTFELGDLVGADENAAGNALLNQQVAKVAAARYADRPRGASGPPSPRPACWSTSARP